MPSIKKDIKEPVQQASIASMLALGLALLALGVAFAAMSRAVRARNDEVWREVTD